MYVSIWTYRIITLANAICFVIWLLGLTQYR